MQEQINKNEQVEQKSKKFTFKFKKKGFDYFGCLSKMAEFALEEAKLLKEILSSYNPDTLGERKDKIHALEHECDLEKHKMTSSLIKDFLPPIDREDLFSLAHVVDNLTDSVESVVVFFYMANITKLREDAGIFADLIIESCEKVVEMFSDFANFKKSEKVKECIVKLNDLEEDGDKLYMNAVRSLSVESKDTREVIEWRDVYRNFEKCLDCAEGIADHVEAIVMKNS